MSFGRLFVRAQASCLASWIEPPQQSGILKSIMQALSVVFLHGAVMAMSARWISMTKCNGGLHFSLRDAANQRPMHKLSSGGSMHGIIPS